MTDTKTYTGGCHCGKVRYAFEAATIEPALACNCSICGKTGALLTFVPEANFRLESGESDLRDYQFNKHHIHHVFCTTCGVRSFANGKAPDGSTTYAVNLRCVDGVEPEQLKLQHFDGRSL